jgi:hypothetical protein
MPTRLARANVNARCGALALLDTLHWLGPFLFLRPVQSISVGSFLEPPTPHYRCSLSSFFSPKSGFFLVAQLRSSTSIEFDTRARRRHSTALLLLIFTAVFTLSYIIDLGCIRSLTPFLRRREANDAKGARSPKKVSPLINSFWATRLLFDRSPPEFTANEATLSHGKHNLNTSRFHHP